MKISLSLFTALSALLMSLNTYSASQSYNLDYELTGKDLETTLKVFLDTENACKQGCLYYMPSVKETKILSYGHTPNKYYIWTHVEDARSAKFFSEAVITKTNTEALVTITQVRFNKGKELAKATGLPNAPIMNSTVNSLKLTQDSASNIKVNYSTRVSYRTLLRPFGARIRAGLINSSKAIQNILAQ